MRILEILAEFFCLPTNHIASLRQGRPVGHAEARYERKVLRELHDAGLVSAIPYFDLDSPYGGRTFAYGLSDKGVKLCKPLFPYAKTFDEHSQRTLDHELEISFFHIALKAFAEKHNLKLYWRQADLKRTVDPDALFALTNPSEPDGKNTLYYFLEIERAKIGKYVNGEPSIMRKLGKFYEYYGTDQCEKEWKDFKQFRVIVVQRTDERRENLLRQLNKEYNHRMFWLTTEDAYKEEIGGEIFATPKDWEKVGYSFLTTQ